MTSDGVHKHLKAMNNYMNLYPKLVIQDSAVFDVSDTNYEDYIPDPSQGLDELYRERAHLVALIASFNDSCLVMDADIENPGWPVVYIETQFGQLSWHINPNSLDLFKDINKCTNAEKPDTWDGHTTDEKYSRIRKLTENYAKRMKRLREVFKHLENPT